MSQENSVDYKKMAWQDIVVFISGQIEQQEFVQKYKTAVAKSSDYANIIESALTNDVSMYDERFAKSFGMQVADFEPLKRAGADHIASKIVPAVFAVAYTRIPNNQIGGDGKPASYDRKRNIGVPALFALRTMANTTEHSVAMKYVYQEYFFPRVISDDRKTNLLSNRSILDSIRQDAKLTEAQNIQMASQSKNMHV